MEKRNVVEKGRTRCSKCARPVTDSGCPYCAKHKKLTKRGGSDVPLKSLSDGLVGTWDNV
jgi:hypothetical protein